MGFFSRKKSGQETHGGTDKALTAEEAFSPVELEKWRDGRLYIEHHRFYPSKGGKTYIEAVSESEPDWLRKSIKALKKLKKVKLTQSKSEQEAIHSLLEEGVTEGIGHLAKEPSKRDTTCSRYRCVLDGKRVGTARASEMPKVAQAYGIADEELPDVIPCRVVLRAYEEKGWSACDVL